MENKNCNSRMMFCILKLSFFFLFVHMIVNHTPFNYIMINNEKRNDVKEKKQKSKRKKRYFDSIALTLLNSTIFIPPSYFFEPNQCSLPNLKSFRKSVARVTVSVHATNEPTVSFLITFSYNHSVNIWSNN